MSVSFRPLDALLVDRLSSQDTDRLLKVELIKMGRVKCDFCTVEIPPDEIQLIKGYMCCRICVAEAIVFLKEKARRIKLLQQSLSR